MAGLILYHRMQDSATPLFGCSRQEKADHTLHRSHICASVFGKARGANSRRVHVDDHARLFERISVGEGAYGVDFYKLRESVSVVFINFASEHVAVVYLPLIHTLLL